MLSATRQIVKLLLIPSSLSPARIAMRFKTEQGIVWVYVGRNYRRLQAWEENLPKRFIRLQCGSLLQKYAMQLRRPFLEFMSAHIRINNPDVVWSSTIFENNTVLSPLFFHICYLSVLEELLRQTKSTVVLVIAEDPAFLATLSLNWEREDLNFSLQWKRLGKVQASGRFLKDIVMILLRPLLFLFENLWEWSLTKVSSLSKKDLGPCSYKRRPVLLRTWVTLASFNEDGIFKDRYLPNLSEWLSTHNHEFLRLPLSESGSIRSFRLLNLLRKPKNRFLIPWDYLLFRDIARTMKICFPQLWLRWGKTIFQKWEVIPLLKAERTRSALSRRSLFATLQGLLVQRLKAHAIPFERCIYPFENKLPEKPFVRTWNRHLPNASLIGFQHSVLYPLKLDLYVDGRLDGQLPLPNKIVSSGSLFRDILLKEYAPFRNVENGPALRFTHLFTTSNGEPHQFDGTILILLPGYFGEMLELLHKALSAIKLESISSLILVKPHPSISTQKLQFLIKDMRFDSLNLKIVSSPLKELFNQSDLIIAMASGAVLDALATGIPLVRVRRETDLDMDPLDWIKLPEEVDFQARSTEELRRQVCRGLGLSQKEREKIVEYSENFVTRSIGALSEGNFKTFIN